MMSSRNFKEEYLVAESSVGKASQSPVSSTSWANQRLNLVGHLLNKQSDDDDDDDEDEDDDNEAGQLLSNIDYNDGDVNNDDSDSGQPPKTPAKDMHMHSDSDQFDHSYQDQDQDYPSSNE